MENYQGLIIKSNGRLLQSKWVYDEEKACGAYEETDVTMSAIRHLFDDCILDDDLVLRDIFLLIQSQCEIFDLVLGNWCQEITEEVFKDEDYPQKNDEIEYLEIYRHIEIEEDFVYGFGRPEFHGIGHAQTPYSVMCSSAYDLQNLPIKVKTSVPIYTFAPPNKWDSPAILTLDNITFTLGEILHAIFWELSFFGSPKMREEKKNELNTMVNEITNEASQGT